MEAFGARRVCARARRCTGGMPGGVPEVVCAGVSGGVPGGSVSVCPVACQVFLRVFEEGLGGHFWTGGSRLVFEALGCLVQRAVGHHRHQGLERGSMAAGSCV